MAYRRTRRSHWPKPRLSHVFAVTRASNTSLAAPFGESVPTRGKRVAATHGLGRLGWKLSRLTCSAVFGCHHRLRRPPSDLAAGGRVPNSCNVARHRGGSSRTWLGRY